MSSTVPITSSKHLPAHLASLLANNAQGYCQRLQMAPPSSYGRHRGPAPNTSRAAAVLLLLYQQDGHWKLPLTLRTEQTAHHRGQISLPGGLLEPGETTAQAALRELAEELGPQKDLQLLGSLPKCYVFASNSDVTPWVAVCKTRTEWNPNPDEVARVVAFPLAMLYNPDTIQQATVKHDALEFSVPCFRVGNDHVWGATAVILDQFKQLLLEERPPLVR
jgi:8-oxo-dGTP pyrophosphatase MutT (NUDIX family)